QTPDDRADDRPAVRFCFDTLVASVPGTADASAGTAGPGEVVSDRYGLSGYNSSVRVRSERARVEPGGPPGCVLAGFPAGIDVARFTLATIGAGAAADGDGRVSAKASRPLTGTAIAPRAGDVTGPNLRRAATDLALN